MVCSLTGRRLQWLGCGDSTDVQVHVARSKGELYREVNALAEL